MKFVSVDPNVLEQLRALVEAQPVVGFIVVAVLTGLWASWMVSS